MTNFPLPKIAPLVLFRGTFFFSLNEQPDKMREVAPGAQHIKRCRCGMHGSFMERTITQSDCLRLFMPLVVVAPCPIALNVLLFAASA